MHDTIQANTKEQTVRDVLFKKHPNGQPAHPDTLLQPPTTTSDVHPVLFDRLDGEMIRHIALQTDGSAGPDRDRLESTHMGGDVCVPPSRKP